MFAMDMKHEFSPIADARPLTAPEQSRSWPLEAYAIAAIFIALWVALGMHVLAEGFSW